MKLCLLATERDLSPRNLCCDANSFTLLEDVGRGLSPFIPGVWIRECTLRKASWTSARGGYYRLPVLCIHAKVGLGGYILSQIARTPFALSPWVQHGVCRRRPFVHRRNRTRASFPASEMSTSAATVKRLREDAFVRDVIPLTRFNPSE